MWTVIGLVVLAIGLWVFGYVCGSNFPYASAKKRIVQAAQDSLNKLKNA